MRKSFLLLLGILAMIIGEGEVYAYYGGPDGPSMIAYVVVAIVIIIVLALICREILCWYWKINERVALLKQINAQLSSLAKGKQMGMVTDGIVDDAAAAGSVTEIEAF